MDTKTGNEDSLIGQVIADRYRVEKLLGAGAMGAVYVATQLSMDRQVALKVLHGSMATNETLSQRFHREMKATARIEHQNTIRVFDYGDTGEGRLFLVIELLDGTTLEDEIKAKGASPARRVARVASQIARALNAAHQEGIVHRDLKPGNVMLLDRYGEADFVKVLDFGIARFLDDTQGLTTEGQVVGTPLYIAPEQAKGEPIDHRADLYALGVMMYEMTTGKVPFQSETLVGLLLAHAQEPPKPLAQVAPGVLPPRLESVVMRLLAKAPDDRFASAHELMTELDACMPEAETWQPGQSSAIGTQPTMATGAPPPAAIAPGAPPAPTQTSQAPLVPEPAKKKGIPTLWIAVALAAVVAVGVVLAVVLGGSGGTPEAPKEVAKVEKKEEPKKEPKEEPKKEPEKRADEDDAQGAQAAKAAEPDAGGAASEATDAGSTPDPGPSVAPAADAGAKVVAAEPDVPREPDVRAAIEESRKRLEEHFRKAGIPLAPEQCRTRDAELLPTLVISGGLLADWIIGAERVQDKAAADTLESARAAGAASAEYWALLAQAMILAERPAAQATHASLKALELCPHYAYAMHLQGTAAVRAKQLEESFKAYQRAIEIAPDWGAPRLNLGNAKLRAKDLDGALAVLDALILKQPDYRGARLLRSVAHQMKGNADGAIADLQAAVAGPEANNGFAWERLGTALKAKGRDDEAHQAFCAAAGLGREKAAKLCEPAPGAEAPPTP